MGPMGEHPCLSRKLWDARRLTAAVAMLLVMPGVLFGQQSPSAPGGWQTGTQIDRTEPQKGARPGLAPPAAGSGFNTTVVPRSAPEAKPAPTMGELSLSALLTEDSEPIEQGMIWRVYQSPPGGAPGGPSGGTKGSSEAKPTLIGTWREAAPRLRLPPGTYVVNGSFGRAHLTRKITLAAGVPLKEPFVLNAGGLRVAALLAGGEQAPANAVSYDIYAGESDQLGARTKIMANAKPSLIVRLNAGIYHLVSTYGDANAIVRADVTVEAGKLSEATVSHLAAKVTFKLVSRAGGEAIADTQWSLQTAQGEPILKSTGALPTHILAAGSYVVSATNGDRVLKREFAVAPGEPIQVEVVAR